MCLQVLPGLFPMTESTKQMLSEEDYSDLKRLSPTGDNEALRFNASAGLTLS